MSANVIATTVSDKPKVKVTVYMTDLGDALNCDIEYAQADDINIAHILDGFSFDFLSADLFDDGDDLAPVIDADHFDDVNFVDKIGCGYFNSVLTAMKDDALIPATYDEYCLAIDADDYVSYLTWRADYYGDTREHIDDGESVRCDLAALRIVHNLKTAAAYILHQDLGDVASSKFKSELASMLTKYAGELLSSV